MNEHFVGEFLIEGIEANTRFADLNSKEIKKGTRYIGGELGDLHFSGYRLKQGNTILIDVEIRYGFDDENWTEQDFKTLAQEILDEAINSIGIECIEHS